MAQTDDGTGERTRDTGPARIKDMGLAFRTARVLLSAVELGVFTALSQGPLHLDELRGRLGLHERGARDFLDTLVALGLLERDASGYANTPETARYLDRGRPDYQGGLLELAGTQAYPVWGHLTEALRSGRPQADQGLYEELLADPGRLRTFLRGMTGLSTPSARALAERLPWSRYRTVADIGPAQGALLTELALRHGHLTGYGFDLPGVRPVFEEYVAEHGVADRVTFVPGDFFEDPLPGADVIVLGHVLHNWDLPAKRMLLEKAYRALPESGLLVVYETLIDDDRRANAFGLLGSLNMLLRTEGGFDFTGADCRGWMAEAGFRDSRVEHLAGPDHMVLAHK
ncbi:methyltransferase [Streptomyces capparidis]